MKCVFGVDFGSLSCRAVLFDAETGVDPADVAGIGIDFTACTLLPVDRELMPLCLRDAYASRPHAYVKLPLQRNAEPLCSDSLCLANRRSTL